MSDAILTLNQMVSDCEVRIRSAASVSRDSAREAATYAHGMVHGYFMAGRASAAEYQVASDRIRAIAEQAERICDSNLAEECR